MKRSLVKKSKFLSLILRHKPETIGLELDPEGWVSIEDLLQNSEQHGFNLNRAILDEVVFTNDKMRFALSPDGLRIRANQGHSLDVELGLKKAEPPEMLFHGTVKRFLNAILAEGLNKMSRQHVHLSATLETARNVGARRGEPVVLSVDATRMHRKKFEFFLSANGVWLTENVPAEFIRIHKP